MRHQRHEQRRAKPLLLLLEEERDVGGAWTLDVD